MLNRDVKLFEKSAKIMNFSKITMRGDKGSPRVEIQLPRVFHRASKSGSTHEPWGMYGRDLMV